MSLPAEERQIHRRLAADRPMLGPETRERMRPGLTHAEETSSGAGICALLGALLLTLVALGVIAGVGPLAF